eukprot:scaffold24846_cov33-Attheya_sp.AAC.4
MPGRVWSMVYRLWQPTIVLGSWRRFTMRKADETFKFTIFHAIKRLPPTPLDCCTASFCATPSIKEYILIGPAPLCGHAFGTWGFHGTTEPIYARSGFTRTPLLELEKIQLCKMDKPMEMFTSRTVSFQCIETC